MPITPLGPDSPSAWVERFADLIAPAGVVLDLAAGGGRHTRLLRRRGHPVVAVDRETSALRALADDGVSIVEADLETEAGWPLGAQRYVGVIVTNYLHRPLFPAIVAAVGAGGILIYETFALGNERFGKPSNPAFLLRAGELIDAVRGKLRILAYEDLEIASPRSAMVQRIVARADG